MSRLKNNYVDCGLGTVHYYEEGGYKIGRGVQVKFYPYKKKGGGGVAMLKGRTEKVLG